MTTEQLQGELNKNPFLLAPMAGITDRAFRSFMRGMGCGAVITELVSATGLKYSSEKTRRLMEFDESQHPVGIQIFGEELEHLDYAAKEIEQMGADFVDLNFGCPVPKVVKKGAGSAVLKDLVRVRDIFRTVKNATKIPVTVKVRTGWDELSRNTPDVVQIAVDEGLAWVAIHGRTRAQGYSGRADWDYISDVKKGTSLPIVGNGDIASAAQAVARIENTGVNAVMIGRGCLKNPWIFQEAMALREGRELKVDRDFIASFTMLENHLSAHCAERIVNLQLRKFAAWFSAGYPNASVLRKQIFADAPLSELRQKIHDFFGPLSGHRPADTSAEPFLMGGHG